MKMFKLLSGATLLGALISTSHAENIELNKDLINAMNRDVGITEAELSHYFQAEKFASEVESLAKTQLGDSYAGSWMERIGENQYKHVVATTDASVKSMGGTEIKHVAYTLKELEDTMSGLNDTLVRVYESAVVSNQVAKSKPNQIQSMYIDVMTNSVVIKATPDGVDSAINFAALSKADVNKIRIETAEGTATPLANIYGGREYISGGGFCSIGFPVKVRNSSTRGFVTAGHCGPQGTRVRVDGANVGSVRRANFPGDDMAWANNRSSDTQYPFVNFYNGGSVLDYRINGSQVAAIGAVVCRSGRTTGLRCGRIQSRNASANYGTGPVFGLTQSTACAGRGDSGGSWVASGGQAQGVTSGGILPGGGNDNCNQSTPTSWFQPVNEILNRYGLELTR
ncbi:S1 family peptidase [Marinicella sp. W31]|uniref:S1 family peptidase n=1 Tax=Marinicella sp. W31 TaxID=3023713 RepID=UPI00375682B8